METVNPDVFWIVVVLLWLVVSLALYLAGRANRGIDELHVRLNAQNKALTILTDQLDAFKNAFGEQAEWAHKMTQTVEVIVKEGHETRERLRNLEVSFHEARTFDPMKVGKSTSKKTPRETTLRVIKNEAEKLDGKKSDP